MIKRTLLAMTFTLLLSSCSWLHAYRPDIQQGNVISNDQLSRVHLGMSAGAVRDIMGDPILKNTFNDQQLTYAYNFIPNYGKPVDQQVILTFKRNRLTRIDKNLNR
jgi:outer membrane protein assembly factor BamE